MDWGLAKVLDQGGVADEERAHPRRADDSAVRTLRSRSEARNRGPARCWARPRTWRPSRPGASWTRSTSGRTSSASARSSARSSPASRPSRAKPAAEVYRKAERADLSEAPGPARRLRRRRRAGGPGAVVPGRRAEGPAAGRGGGRGRPDGLPRRRPGAAPGGRAGPGQGRDPRRRGAEAPAVDARAGRVGARDRPDRRRRMGLDRARAAVARESDARGAVDAALIDASTKRERRSRPAATRSSGSRRSRRPAAPNRSWGAATRAPSCATACAHSWPT